MPLDEFLIVFFGLLVVVFVEFDPRILLDRLHVLPWAVEGTSVQIRRSERMDITCRPVYRPALHYLHSLALLQYPGWDQVSEIQYDIDARKNNTLAQ